MFCPNCGKEIKEVVKFCKYCGTAIETIAEQPVEIKAGEESNKYTRMDRKKKIMLSIFGVCIILAIILVKKHTSEPAYAKPINVLENIIGKKNTENLDMVFPIKYFNEESRLEIENVAKELANSGRSVNIKIREEAELSESDKSLILYQIQSSLEDKTLEIGEVHKVLVDMTIKGGATYGPRPYVIFEIDGEYYLDPLNSLNWISTYCMTTTNQEEKSNDSALVEDAIIKETEIEETISKETAPEKEVVPVTYDSYEALGSFSEGLALVRRSSDGRLAYIDTEGNIKIVLPEKYISATSFSDGRAAVCTGDSLFIPYVGYGWMLQYMLDHEYALIDSEGNTIVDVGVHDFIGRTAEGKTLVYNVTESYQGTEKKFGFIDLNGNLLFEIDATPYVGYDGGKLYVESIFFKQGTAVFERSGVTTYNMNGQDFYDETGKLVKQLNASEAVETVYSDVSFVSSSYDAKKKFLVYSRSTNQTENLSTNDIKNHLSHGFLASDSFVQGYVAIIGGPRDGDNGKFIIVDTSGTVVGSNGELNISAVMETEEDAWVVELQNGYYGIVDHTAQLLFEPIQEEIVYLGDGLFYGKTTKNVFNKYGEKQFIAQGVPYDNSYYQEVISHYTYEEGFIIVNVAGTDRFMDKNGNVLWETVVVEGNLSKETETENKATEYLLGEDIIRALCKKDGETAYTYYHPKQQELMGKDYLISYILKETEDLFETSGDYIVTFEGETVWNGKKEMESSNIAHIEGMEAMLGASIEDFKVLEYKITSSAKSDSGLVTTVVISLAKVQGEWYLMWRA